MQSERPAFHKHEDEPQARLSRAAAWLACLRLRQATVLEVMGHVVIIMQHLPAWQRAVLMMIMKLNLTDSPAFFQQVGCQSG